ncbi:unnamed protein product [Hermetia illucens]|uniref:Uncharacterized protein n=1 Tax=Hermetia illucens TaxID=343691 RepID=A0A7R8YPU7_HERIL|nr:unnamed protein product [Hermetia illucens]
MILISADDLFSERISTINSWYTETSGRHRLESARQNDTYLGCVNLDGLARLRLKIGKGGLSDIGSHMALNVPDTFDTNVKRDHRLFGLSKVGQILKVSNEWEEYSWRLQKIEIFIVGLTIILGLYNVNAVWDEVVVMWTDFSSKAKKLGVFLGRRLLDADYKVVDIDEIFAKVLCQH